MALDNIREHQGVYPITPQSPKERIREAVKKLIHKFTPDSVKWEDLKMGIRVGHAMDRLVEMHESGEIDKPNPNLISPPDLKN